MALSNEIKEFIKKDVLERFLKYVQIYTTSDEESESTPSTKRQFELANLLKKELEELGLKDVEVDEYCYVYATLPASEGYDGPAISFCAHLDTSPDVSGENVKPIIHKDYDGGNILFPDDPELVLTPEESPELKEFVGDDIITASGKTLLGADDKAGIAEIMSGLAALVRFKELKHPELKICFTPDEEIGRGVDKITLSKLGKYCYTFDGGMIGELEAECFDAHYAKIKFIGSNVHPGYAKNKMVNAASIAARFIAALPEYETPEHTENREGFFHLLKISGDVSETEIQFIIRDFDKEVNQRRIKLLKDLVEYFKTKYPGLSIDFQEKEQYKNMYEVLKNHKEVLDIAEKAMIEAGIKVEHKAIRGGTDGARLCFMGVPTPNIFAGGLNFHSKKEWVACTALLKATETFLNLCKLWYGNK